MTSPLPSGEPLKVRSPPTATSECDSISMAVESTDPITTSLAYGSISSPLPSGEPLKV
eukprot:CAMPEP_0119299714 /NCGR_PEP_ID=MMETSP1333-20130426/1753_1 /TAXON_ID=418940 /ORGANISM="Scyphosphaera apsteinii, Strain RCC1455" /LENGTH=57 /DNA_ID=CAMNT_0007301233 /DNA_START=20 /DNA_END=190 /DNA_ORIENTATION=-